MLRPLWVGRLHGEKSDEVATQIAPQSPSENRRITIKAGPTGSIRAALAAEWFDWMTCCAHEAARRDLGNPERDGGSRGLLGEFPSMKGVER
jgi:hypothetical protein